MRTVDVGKSGKLNETVKCLWEKSPLTSCYDIDISKLNYISIHSYNYLSNNNENEENAET